MKIIFTLIVVMVFFLAGCKNKKEEQIILKSDDLEEQMIEAYNEGIKAFEEGDMLFAAKNFNNVENIYPQSIWAPRSILMAAYSYYYHDYYGDAISELKRFLKNYPENENYPYAYYLMASCYYELIVDEKKDLSPLLNSKKYFNIVIKQFPNTDFALDAKFKLDLIENVLASKEIYIGKYYVSRKKWIPAINRFKNVVNDYETTIYIEEALYRLVEVYYLLGLKEESKKYANLLGYNYQSSEWYENSYILFDKKYKKNNLKKIKLNKEKNNNILQKIKSIFN